MSPFALWKVYHFCPFRQVSIVQRSSSRKLYNALRRNLQSALYASLLQLPESFTEEQLFLKIAGLSYGGRRKVGSWRRVLMFLTAAKCAGHGCAGYDRSAPRQILQTENLLHANVPEWYFQSHHRRQLVVKSPTRSPRFKALVTCSKLFTKKSKCTW